MMGKTTNLNWLAGFFPSTVLMQTPPIPIWANINTLRPRLRGYALVHVAFFNRHLLALQHCGSKLWGGDSTAILKAHELQVPICTTIMWGKWSPKLSRLGATCNYSAAGHLSQSTFKLCPSKSEEAPARQLVKGLAMLHWLVCFFSIL